MMPYEEFEDLIKDFIRDHCYQDDPEDGMQFDKNFGTELKRIYDKYLNGDETK